MTVDTTDVTLDELRDLFTGVPHEDGGWTTAPCFDAGLAFEIAKRSTPVAETDLRTVLYDDTTADDIPAEALTAIRLGFQRYRVWHTLQHRNRGL